MIIEHSTEITSILPIFYYPLKIMFVDDNVEILESFRDILDTKYDITFLSNPKEALQILQNSSYLDFTNIFNEQTENKEINFVDNIDNISTYKFSLKNIATIVESNAGNNSYGILITDYEMPELNGIELCNKMNYTYLKKVLLTGKYNINNGIESLHNNEIDRYIEKGAQDADKKLESNISKLTLEYFTDLTNNIYKLIGNKKFNFLKDPFFIQLFVEQVKASNIQKYYMISNNGNFVLIDDNGNKYILIIYDEKDLINFYELYENESTIIDFIEPLRQANYVPFFGVNVSPEQIHFENWKNKFYASKKFHNYYWNLSILKSE